MLSVLGSLCLDVFVLANVIHCLCPNRLRVEYQENPIGLDVEYPRFFWSNDNEGLRGDTQTAYQLIVYNTETGGIVANSNKIKSAESSQITINNFAIVTHGHYRWTVQIWNTTDHPSIINDNTIAFIDAGILAINKSQWSPASWLYIPNYNTSKDNMVMNQFRTEFDINSSSPIQKAWCYIVSPNYYVAYLNNIKTDDHVLGYFTTFERRSYYDMFDCKDMLKNGRNVVGITLGNGWYSQPTVNIGAPIVKIMLHMQFMNGDRLEIFSNQNSTVWYQNYGPIRMNDIYIGEWYDATLETDGWLLPYYNYENTSWIIAKTMDNPIIGPLKSSAIMPKITKVETYATQQIITPKQGVYVFDFGQNVAGFTSMKIPGNNMRGYNLTFIHSEQINQSGFVVDLYKHSPMITTYTLKGDGNEEYYTPYFTYYGYQYVQVQGYPLDIGVIIPSTNMLTSHFIHTDFDYIGSINFAGESSDNKNANLLNNIESLTRFASLSNYMNVPTDCPQRERRGWLGDAQLTIETVLYHWDIPASYTKYLLDISDTYITTNGTDGIYNALPDVAPWYHHGKYPGDPSWTNAYIFFVYKMYKYFGDESVIYEHYYNMKLVLSYLDSVIDNKTGLYPYKYGWHGDWCSLVPVNDSAPQGNCQHNSAMINTYQYAKQCEFFSEMANVTGDMNNYETYQTKFMHAKQAIYNMFWDANEGLFVDNLNNESPISTLQSLGLDLGVLTNTSDIQRCVDAMVYDISVTNGGHLVQGIVGVKYILKQLCEHNQCLLALNTTLQEKYVSYDFWYENGATTLWEHWNTTRYDNDGASKNHIMFGTQSAFYFQYLAGIRQTEESVNWKHIVIDPFTNSTIFGINMIASEVGTLTGTISVSWNVITSNERIDDSMVLWETLDVHIPSGSIAYVYFRRLAVFGGDYIDMSNWEIQENEIVIWKNNEFIKNADQGVLNGNIIHDDALRFEIASGQYTFKMYTV